MHRLLLKFAISVVLVTLSGWILSLYFRPGVQPKMEVFTRGASDIWFVAPTWGNPQVCTWFDRGDFLKIAHGPVAVTGPSEDNKISLHAIDRNVCHAWTPAISQEGDFGYVISGVVVTTDSISVTTSRSFALVWLSAFVFVVALGFFLAFLVQLVEYFRYRPKLAEPAN